MADLDEFALKPPSANQIRNELQDLILRDRYIPG